MNADSKRKRAYKAKCVLSALGLLLLTLVILKLTSQVAWSWWWVFSPLWLPLALAVLLGALFCVLLGVTLMFAPKEGEDDII